MYVDDVCLTKKGTGLWGVYSNPFELTVKPNPINNYAHLTLNLPEYSSMRFRIYNVTGSIIFEKNQNMEAGRNELSFETTNLANGVYTIEAYSLTSNAKSIVKVIK